MERRHFIRATLAGAAGAAAVSAGATLPARAAAKPALTNIVYTAADPAHYASVVALHVPEVSVHDGRITVTTPHPMSEAHYIVSHTVVLEDGRFLSRKTFGWHDKPVSEHVLPKGYRGKVSITSTCNVHDWWLKEITV
jgi:superoxide reductase